jgi:hypothetical protein
MEYIRKEFCFAKNYEALQFVLVTIYNYADRIMEDQPGGKCSNYTREVRNVCLYKILDGKPENNRPTGRSRYR